MSGEGAQGRRDSEGEEEVRPGELFVQVRMEPLLGCMLLALWTVAVATGMMDAVVPPTAWALREAVAVVSACGTCWMALMTCAVCEWGGGDSAPGTLAQRQWKMSRRVVMAGALA